MSADDTLRLIELTRNELDRLEAAVRTAGSYQWDRPPGQKASPGEVRGRGGHSDPTGDTAVDPTRLSVREALRLTHQDADRVFRTVRSMTGRVQHAARRWEGP